MAETNNEALEGALEAQREATRYWFREWEKEGAKRVEAEEEAAELQQCVDDLNAEIAECNVLELKEEIDQLKSWKESALSVMSRWDNVWESLGRPGELGRPKSEGVLAEIERLKSEVDKWRNDSISTGKLADYLAEQCDEFRAAWRSAETKLARLSLYMKELEDHEYIWGRHDAMTTAVVRERLREILEGKTKRS